MIRTRLAGALLACLVAPAPAHALSCMRPNPGQDIQRLARQDIPAQVIVGQLAPLDPADRGFMPKYDGQHTRRGPSVRYRLTGRALHPDGYGPRSKWTVTVTPTCLASWCGGLPRTGSPRLWVLPGPGPDVAYDAGPCPQTDHAVPGPQGIAALQRCLSGTCTQADIRTLAGP